MTNDAGTLATALYATAGDMLREHPGLAPWRPPAGIAPRLGDAGLVTLATVDCGRSRETVRRQEHFGRGFERELSEHGARLLRPARNASSR